MKTIKLFSTPGCVYCQTLKSYLKKKEVDFEEVDISEDEEALNEVVEETGKMEVPVLKIDDQYIKGFDKNKIDKLL